MYELLPGVSLSRSSPPSVSPNFIIRNQLLEILDKPSPNVVFAIAPSGFGKTILAAQWAARHPDKTIWYTPALTDSFKDLVFHCVSSLRRFKPDAAPWIEKYRTIDFDPQSAVTEFANEISSYKHDIHFITDGAHNIHSDNEEFTQLWARVTPENLKIFNTRNNLPPINYEKAISLDALTFIKPIDLAFNQDEINILATSLGVDYELHQELVSEVQNWPAGVMMTLKNIQKNGTGVIANFSDSKMLVEATLKNIEASDYEILEKLVYFKKVSREQAVNVLKLNTKFRSFLRLVSEGIFVREAGNTESDFVINEIIKNAIKERLSLDTKRAEKIRLDTVQENLKAGEYELAIEHLEELGEKTRAKDVVSIYIRKLLWNRDRDGLLKNTDLISRYLEVGKTGEDITNGYYAMAFSKLDELAIKIKTLEKSARKNEVFDKAECDLHVLESRLAFGLGNLTKVIALNRNIAPSSRSQFSLRITANAAFLMEDLGELQNIAKEAIAAPPANELEENLHLPAIEALLALAEGRLHDALDLAKFVIAEGESVGVSGVWLPFDMAYCQAEVLREIGEDRGGIEVIERYREAAFEFDMSPWLAGFESKHAFIEAQLGRPTAGLHRIRKIRDELNLAFLHLDTFRVIDEHELVIRSLLRDFERMAEIIYRTPQAPTVSVISASLELKKKGDSANHLLADLPRNTPRERILCGILQINLNLDRPKIAEEVLEEILPEITKHSFHQVLVVQSPKFKEFLLQFAATHPTVYMEQISKGLRQRMADENAGSKKMENPLTKREVEILNRLSTGVPISQIATNLHISNNTIKTHLKNVYKKLGVDSRETAVAKGQELLLF